MQLETALHILGIEGLRPFQEEALNTLLADRNLLTLMPTSAGKSLIFTSFAMVQERLTIVIEPHLALELDQVRQLQQGRCRRLLEQPAVLGRAKISPRTD